MFFIITQVTWKSINIFPMAWRELSNLSQSEIELNWIKYFPSRVTFEGLGSGIVLLSAAFHASSLNFQLKWSRQWQNDSWFASTELNVCLISVAICLHRRRSEKFTAANNRSLLINMWVNFFRIPGISWLLSFELKLPHKPHTLKTLESNKNEAKDVWIHSGV